ncbi:Choline-sulfatase [Crateriforma conspicua]|uniref:Choline-sulfatase n=2 Tax=Planctomycetaceae TaxID=126 RepID=A0A5C6FVG2_9PLAN|nr:Choline-sulfatase [Crateriforma conspicua]
MPLFGSTGFWGTVFFVPQRCSVVRLFSLLFVLTQGMVLGGVSATAAEKNEQIQTPANVLLICVDDLRPELNCFGQSYIQSPAIDALAEDGVRFTRHYVQAPTCGASRYAMLTGRYGPYGNAALLNRGKTILKQGDDADHPTMPGWFRRNGYATVSVGKVSHHPGGRAGADWDDGSQPEMPGDWDRHLMPCGPWMHPRGAMHGLANGQIRRDAGKMDVFEAFDGSDESYPDGLIVETALSEMRRLQEDASGKPWFLAVGLIRPHLPFGAPAKYLQRYDGVSLPPIEHPQKPEGETTWHRSGEFMKYNRWGRDPNVDHEFATEVRRHYAACVSYADAQVAKLLDQLEQLAASENTIVVLWGDHGWHLGEHAIWGKHALFEEALRSPLIIRDAGSPSRGGVVEHVVESIDVFPTLCDLASLPMPEFAHGQSLRPLLADDDQTTGTAVSYTKATTIRSDRFRLILHPSGHVELYDHASGDGETVNVAQSHPDVVKKLTRQMQDRLARRER